MRPKASHPGPHYSWIPAPPCDDCFSPAALETSAAGAEARLGFVISRSSFRNGCGGQRPPALRANRGGGRNARATSRAFARLWMFSPSAIHSRESPLPLALPQSSG